MKRNIYIDNMDADLAKKIYFEKLDLPEEYEEVPVTQAIGRVSFEAIHAKLSSPNYNAAAMDGIAVISQTTFGASQSKPLSLVESRDFIYVNTGNQIKEPYDAVIMIEDVMDLGQGKIQILNPAYPWQHIRQIGEDIIATEMILPSRHEIRPIDIGALISGGIETIKVYKKPRVGILPTGSEIVENAGDLEDGKIIDSNSRVFEGEVEKLGGLPNRYPPLVDNYDLLKENIEKLVDKNDIVLINAGSSAGSKDYTVEIIRELGEVIVHGVAIKPGKPTILGLIKNKPVIGIPGYPVSAYLVFDTFVKPLLERYIGLRETKKETVSATISKRISSSLKNKDLIRVNLGLVNDRLIATPLASGAGVTMSLVKADGIAIIPQNLEGIEAGDSIEVELLKPLTHIEHKLVSIGSHDLIMDILADMIDLSSGHVGSMGGILAMRRGESHISPIHLLDEESGHYNIAYVKKYFPGKDMALIKGVKRLQGFIVVKGNPAGIKNFTDLSRQDIIFVNRQRGAGTRVLLDYYLKDNNINPQDIKGYKREMNTHMAVAAAVKTGSATTGLGILSAARAMDLDFVEVAYEDYDFLLPYDLLEKDEVSNFIEVLKSKDFKDRVMALGGYKFEDTGSIIRI